MPIWNQEFETMCRNDLRQLQLERLKAVVERVAQTSPLYQHQLAEAGIKAENIRHLEDIAQLPFTTKSNLRYHYPWGLLNVPLREVVRVHASSGTTGKPVVVGYTRADMALWAEVMARSLTAIGITSDDILHNAFGYGLFTGGLGYQLGAETIGASVVPISAGMTHRQVTLLQDFGATALTCTPSYALVIAEEAAALGIDIRKRCKVRVGAFGAEPWTEKMRTEMEAALNLSAYDLYGLTELIGPGVSVECEHRQGLHIFEDHFYPEVIDPATGEPLDYGMEGELVLTNLTKEATSVIRYRTHDRTTLYAEKCACGRTLVRMDKVLGRTDDMMIVRGVNVFPSQVEQVLLGFKEIQPYYQIIIDRPRHELDTIEIRVEAEESLFSPVETDRIPTLQHKIECWMRDALLIHATVKLVQPRTIERTVTGKTVRVIDRRQLDK